MNTLTKKQKKDIKYAKLYKTDMVVKGSFCPRCLNQLVFRKNRIKGNYFVGCRSYPNCHYTRELFENEVKIIDKILKKWRRKGTTMSKSKEQLSIQQQFLLSLFDDRPINQIIREGKFVLVKNFNEDLNDWKVGIYTKSQWKRIKKMKL